MLSFSIKACIVCLFIRVGRHNSTPVDEGRKRRIILDIKLKARAVATVAGRGERRACLMTPDLSSV